MFTIENLSVEFGSDSRKVTAVDQVSLQLKKGEALGLVGESGSGKSITALSIMQLLPVQAKITSGNILFNDDDLLKNDFATMRRLRGNSISMIFQEPMTSLNPVMRCGMQVAESICLHQKVNTKTAHAKVLELFNKVKLPRPESIYQSYPHEISGGQMQRVMIAMAVANKPEILIADEPTTALDVTVQREIIRLLNDLRNEYGMSLLFISHDLALVSEIVDEVAVMYKGKIVEKGEIVSVFKNPKHPYTKGLLACRPPLDKRLKKLLTVDEFMETFDEDITPAYESLLVSPAARQKEHEVLYAKQPLLNIENLEKKFPLKKPLIGKVKSYVYAVDDVKYYAH